MRDAWLSMSFREEDHPRDESGRFSSGGGGGAPRGDEPRHAPGSDTSRSPHAPDTAGLILPDGSYVVGESNRRQETAERHGAGSDRELVYGKGWVRFHNGTPGSRDRATVSVSLDADSDHARRHAEEHLRQVGRGQRIVVERASRGVLDAGEFDNVNDAVRFIRTGEM